MTQTEGTLGMSPFLSQCPGWSGFIHIYNLWSHPSTLRYSCCSPGWLQHSADWLYLYTGPLCPLLLTWDLHITLMLNTLHLLFIHLKNKGKHPFCRTKNFKHPWLVNLGVSFFEWLLRWILSLVFLFVPLIFSKQKWVSSKKKNDNSIM